MKIVNSNMIENNKTLFIFLDGDFYEKILL